MNRQDWITALTQIEGPGRSLADTLLEAMRLAPAPLVLTAADGTIRHVNAAFEQATGYGASELCGHKPSILRSGLQGDGFYRGLWADLKTLGHWQGEVWNRRKDGSIFQEFLSIVALHDAEGRPSHYFGMYSSLPNVGSARRRANGQGDMDATTGLLNRGAFLAAADRLGEQYDEVRVFALDIDGFTELNEQYGLEGGDAVLRQAAVRCIEVGSRAGYSYAVGRVGADEFALAMAAPASLVNPFEVRAWLDERACRLDETMRLPFEIDGGRKLALSATVGMASLRSGNQRAAEALLHASSARQQAGTGGPQHYEVQDARRQRAHALREAIREDSIHVAFQPKVDLRTGALAGVEALARWTLPDGTVVPPSEFIPLAEQRGLIGLLGDRVLERAAAQLASWRVQGLTAPRVAVNFSALQFHRADTARQVAQILQRHAVPVELLELELTESLLIGEMDSVMATLDALRNFGIELSIDDFGTGYSSLAYLRRFPIQCLKIDRQFVVAMTEDDGAREIVRLIVELSHRLGLRCVAEGIETQEQLRQLQAMGCDEGQGYVLSRPLDVDAMVPVLAGAVPWAPLFARQESQQVDLAQEEAIAEWAN